jgi:hypothetical protein
MRRFIIWLRLWPYNNIKRPLSNWRFRRQFRHEWIAAGRDPWLIDKGPSGRITVDDWLWAIEAAGRQEKRPTFYPASRMSMTRNARHEN